METSCFNQILMKGKIMEYYISNNGFFYQGDCQPGDRKATEEEISEHFKDHRTYHEKRASAYPDYREFLDAQVKISSDNPDLQIAGQQQLQKYVQDCLNIKNQYPKP